MCGINGIFAYRGPEPSADECIRTRDAMSTRGPDGAGFWRAPGGKCVLGHRRLSIIDISPAGAQPMSTKDGAYTIVFNGEIYNYEALRAELVQDGVPLHSHSDTEVLLNLYHRERESMTQRLRGMFAFALWSEPEQALFLARDPHGIKPLYYHDDGRVLRFASSVRALLPHLPERALDARSIVGYLGWGSVPEPRTLWKGLSLLPAGATLAITDHVHEPKRYWSVASAYRTNGAPATVEEVREVITSSVRAHLVADVPVGAFLSAGVDSGAMVGTASALLTTPIRTFTLAFEDFRGTPRDEAPVAELIASTYGTDHHTEVLDQADLERILGAFFDAMDQPTIDGLNVYLVSALAKRAGLKAVLSGVGGDELFGGYGTFRSFSLLHRTSEHVPDVLYGMTARVFGLAGRRLPNAGGKLGYVPAAARTPQSSYHLLRGLFMPAQVERLVRPEIWSEAGGEPGLTRFLGQELPERVTNDSAWMSVAEQTCYMRNQLLRDADWASMAHSIELRTPLVDRCVTDTLGSRVVCKHTPPKRLLARVPSPELPAEVLNRPKTGFFLPLERFLDKAFAAFDARTLPDAVFGQRQRTYAADVVRRSAAGRLHWSRGWAIVALSRYLERAA